MPKWLQMEYNPARQRLVKRSSRLTAVALALSAAIRYGLGGIGAVAWIPTLVVAVSLLTYSGVLLNRAFKEPHWTKEDCARAQSADDS